MNKREIVTVSDVKEESVFFDPGASVSSADKRHFPAYIETDQQYQLQLKDSRIIGYPILITCACDGNVISEDYVNPCREAACRQHNGPCYHLGCGSQERVLCELCGKVFRDSSKEEIAAAEWEEIEWGGNIYLVPTDYAEYYETTKKQNIVDNNQNN